MSQDREFETYPQGENDLSQLYDELPEVELPDHLDNAILAEAHRAVESRPAAITRRRWNMPLSIAASVIVAITLGLQLPALLEEAALPQLQMEERPAPAMEMTAAKTPPAMQAESQDATLTEKEKAEFLRTEPARMAIKPEASVVQNASVMDAAKTSIGVTRTESSVTLAPDPVAIRQQLSADDKPLSSGLTAGATAGAAASAPSPQSPSLNAVSRYELLKGKADTSSGLVATEERKDAARQEGNASATSEQIAPAAASMAAPQPAQRVRALMQLKKAETREDNPRPDDWLLGIERLKQQGRLEEAKKELAEFKLQYPNYPLPEGIDVK